MNHTDIKTEGWISNLPQDWQPYAILMRLDRPIGWWLLLLPGWWGIVLGSNGVVGMYSSDWRLMVLFLIGAIIMRGAGCIVNDLWDRDLDKQVERTKMRPLASGQVPIVNAIILLFFLLFTGFVMLLMMSGVAIKLGILSIIFIGTYPLMKRITWWPQAFLGLTFNLSALIGWGAATHHLGWEPLMLYAAGFFWTMGYDTIYAHQDKEDDAIVGIKSTARLFGDNSKLWVSAFYSCTFILLVATALYAGAGLISLALLILPAIHLYRQIQDWDMDDPEISLLIFKSNRNFGLLVLLCFALIGILPALGVTGEFMNGLIESLGLPTIPHIGFLGAAQQ